MKLKDIANMEEYLENDCYCPGEIYDMSGFFFRVYHAEDECVLITKGISQENNEDVICVVCDNQLINFWIKDKERGREWIE